MMTDQDKSDMTLLIRAQLEEQHGKPDNIAAFILGTLLVVSVGVNVMLGYTLHEYRQALIACWELLP